jgi:hypothetical protein
MFLIDASSSMQVNIDAVRQGMPLFVDQIAAKKTDAQYGVVLFGAVATEVVLDWTPSATLARDVIKQVIAGNGNNFTREPYNLIHFDHDCKHTNGCGTRESTFEAIRMVLGRAKNNTFIRHPMSQTALLSGGITWRMGAERYIFLVTDEDSDCPFYDVNRYFDGPTQQCTTPGFIGSDNDGTYQPTKFFGSDSAWPNLPNPWQQEVVDTAKAIYDGRGHVSMFVKPTNGRTRPQFGDPSFAVQVQNIDFSNFSAAGTLALLRSSGLNNSLQALTLALQINDPLVADDLRIFDTRNITSPNVVDNFFKEVAKTIVNACFGRKRQMANCQLNYCDVDGTRQCRSDPRCDAGAKNCDNCKIPDGNKTLCVFDGAANPKNKCQICSFYRSQTTWSDGCDDRDDCTLDECVYDAASMSNKCVHSDLCTPQCGRCAIEDKDGTHCFGAGTINERNPCEQCDPLNGVPVNESCVFGNFTSFSQCQSYNWWSPIVPPPAGKNCKQTACKKGTLDCDCLDGFCAPPGNGSAVECAAGKCVLLAPATPAPPTPLPPACDETRRGEVNCLCFNNGTCASPSVVFCLDQNKTTEKCIVCPGCSPPAGTLGNPCRPSNHPYIATVGECDSPLVCQLGICAMRTAQPTPAPACTPGTAACQCLPNEQCTNSASTLNTTNELICVSNVCQPIGCLRGEKSCRCRPGNVCDGELLCDLGTNRCRDCRAGEVNCVCREDNTCDGKLVCAPDGRCLDTCSLPSPQKCCVPGSAGCVCKTGNQCLSQLQCTAFGICRAPEDDDDPCHSACRSKAIECAFGPLMCSCDGGALNLVCRKQPPVTMSTDPEVITAASTTALALASLLVALSLAFF